MFLIVKNYNFSFEGLAWILDRTWHNSDLGQSIDILQYFMTPILESSAFYISDQYCHYRSDNYIILPIMVGPRKLDWVVSASANHSPGEVYSD